MYKTIYQCCCDFCGQVITQTYGKKPTEEELKDIGAVVLGRRVFCDEECKQEWKHYVTVSRCGNLKQFQPGKPFKRI